jgi:competence protein ComEC
VKRIVIVMAVGLCCLLALGCAGAAPSDSSTTVGSETAATAAPTPETTTTGADAGAAPGKLQVHFIDVGYGDAILVLSPEGKVMLIDGGESGAGALDYLLSLGIDHVDLMVATHADKDHIGGLVDILHALRVSQVITNGQPGDSKTYAKFLEAIAETQAVRTDVKRGDRLQLGSLTFAVLHPGQALSADLDQDSIVLRLVYGTTSFLFTADTGDQAEADMLASGEDLRADVLKVGHHGSGSSASPAFLAAVAPKVAIYSADGADSNHPSQKTLAALAGAGAEVYGTDVNGTVVVTSDGTTIKVTPQRGGAR